MFTAEVFPQKCLLHKCVWTTKICPTSDGFSHSEYNSKPGKIWCWYDKIERFIFWLNSPLSYIVANLSLVMLVLSLSPYFPLFLALSHSLSRSLSRSFPLFLALFCSFLLFPPLSHYFSHSLGTLPYLPTWSAANLFGGVGRSVVCFLCVFLTITSVFRTSVFRTSVCHTSVCRTSVCRRSVCCTSVWRTSVYRTSVCHTSVCCISVCRTSVCLTSICCATVCRSCVCRTGVFCTRIFQTCFLAQGVAGQLFST